MKIVFMGSPEFACPTLEKLANSNNEVVAVYTKAPKNSGRGMKEVKSAIHKLSEKFSLNIFVPKKLKDPDALNQFKEINPDIAIVAAYGLIIPKEFLEIPKFGFINIHPSDLPRWRGAAPIQRTIMAGDNKTAICIMRMDEGLDTGDIILRKKIILDNTLTAKELHDKCSKLGADMILEALKLFETNKVIYRKQDSIGITYAEKISSQEELLDFNLTAVEVNNVIRALSPKPGAYFIYNNEIIKIICATTEENNEKHQPGTVIDNNLSIACKDSILKPTLLQRQGRKMIYTDAFLRGFNITKGTKLNK
ncbi:methionyl-tRNA formyltransferase [Rickettsiales endosymbiont of Trichoplax sp. H2]|uniref:methionyl-tRNA formyltransferase n=1 Tax=Rickettsiales endosymbiont of Trichoplax sp. H2 TaxID=2021221 RepID=UPI0012B42F85|nr:methionyl-tRNA formyltransferase [Rickettsiales endosymbiont of Trichoplax sp. H2]MSO13235.1 Methionyl-tRNA formyltransferase [Rickettsiales endosymbiont of Trichoplax sp. H2]